MTRSPLATCRIALDATRRAIPRLAEIMRPTAAAVSPVVARAAEALPPIAPDAIPAATLASWYAYAAASDPDALPYDLSFWRAGVSVVGTALSTWLGLRGSTAAVPVAAGTVAAATGLSTLQVARHGTYVTRTWRPGSWRDIVFNQAMPALHASFLPLSIAAAYSPGPAIAPRVISHIPEALRSRWPLLRRLGLYYMVFSILGHWGEILFCIGIKHGLIRGGYDRENHMLWDQWLFPFPAEGSVAVLTALFLYPAKMAIERHHHKFVEIGYLSGGVALGLSVALTFFLNQIVCTSVDFTTGLVANQNYELWDYRDMPFNYKGQICLQNSLVYGVLSTSAAWLLFPRMEHLMATASSAVLDGAFVGLGSFFVFLELLYHVLPPKSKDDSDKDVQSPEEASPGPLPASQP